MQRDRFYANHTNDLPDLLIVRTVANDNCTGAHRLAFQKAILLLQLLEWNQELGNVILVDVGKERCRKS